ncbi:hypothetical protein [Ornithinibacillus contaminans]|uniref:hypothetical protein n=1 Tax=Ornithinibacillus contaminans TaxID=694055 RepID=UPI0014705600|nr:hypothetical protein [Ornithinibacillus contaminans]
MTYYYNPQVKLLLINQSDETEEILYDNHAQKWKTPLIGPRPPYYANPRYEQYYPLI